MPNDERTNEYLTPAERFMIDQYRLLTPEDKAEVMKKLARLAEGEGIKEPEQQIM